MKSHKLIQAYRILLQLYPQLFRDEFGEEMTTIFNASVTEAKTDGPGAVARLCLKELTDAPSNLTNAYWHELVDKEVIMNRNASWGVWPIWVIFHLLSIPLALLLMLIIVIIANSIVSPFNRNIIPQDYQLAALIVGFAIVTGMLQWLLLRRYLSHGITWGIATAIGIVAGSILAYLAWFVVDRLGYSEHEIVPGIILLSVGISVSFAQYLVLRRILKRAGWWIIANAAGYSVLVLGNTQFITSVSEVIFLIALPAIITGAALILLLKQGQVNPVSPMEKSQHIPESSSRSFRQKSVRAAIGILIILIFCLVAPLVWTTGQLTVAKANGIYATPEEGMIARIEKNTGGYGIDHIQVLFAKPNDRNGRLPHIYFVGANVFAEKRPDGRSTGPKGYWSAGSFFVKVKDGWVHVPEGAFPPFMGKVMAWYRLEGCCTTE